jgi:hypothetical protein
MSIRESAFSAAACEKLVNERATPGWVVLVVLKLTPSPKNRASTSYGAFGLYCELALSTNGVTLPHSGSRERQAGNELEVSRIGSRFVVEIQERRFRPVALPQRENGCRCGLSDEDALRFGRRVRNGRQCVRICGFDEGDGWIGREANIWRELREQRDEHVVCRRRNRGFR